MGAAAARPRAVLQLCCACWLLLASLAVSSFADAARLTGSLQEQQNAVCSFVSRARAELLPPSKQSKCSSTVNCLINELGPPKGAELFVAHLAAVHDYCTAMASNLEQCNAVPFCRAMLPDADGRSLVEAQSVLVAQRASKWYQVVTGERPEYQCRPDWFALLSQPCEGSAAAQMQHCLQGQPASGACPIGCRSVKLGLDRGYCNTAECWPPWVLKQLCNSTVQDFLHSSKREWCTNGWCPGSCRNQSAANCTEPCVHEACAVAAQYVREFAWTGFHGACKHTAAVGQLLANAPSIFEGFGCSVRQWIDNSTTDLGVLMSKVCQGTYPRPARLMPFLQDRGALGKVWLTAAASDVWESAPRGLRARQVASGDVLDFARHSVLSFASTQQAALIQCPVGYRAMDNALSKPWLSPELLKAVLPPDSAWRVGLLQGMPSCAGGATSSSDVCWELRGSSNPSKEESQAVPLLVSNTSLAVLEAYCRDAFAPAPTSSPVPPADVTASCDKVFRETEKVRQVQAARRAALAVIWYAYLIFLLVGFAGLQVYWRFPRRRARRGQSRGIWVANIAGRLWYLLCPSVPDYRASAPQAVAGPASQSGPATARWRAWLISKAVNGAQALAYCVDVGLDIWTLVELKRLADGHAELAGAYPTGGEYFTQLSWRSDHSNMLFWWLIIVFIGQYAAGILLTLPPTLAAYGVFDYQRLQFSWGCCTLVFCTGAFGIFVGLFFFVGLWYILVADVYMLLAVVGVPAKLLQGNRLNLPAYTTVRYLCEGILEALPSALISTAVLNQQLLYDLKDYKQLGVFWLSLIFSMLRIARELYKLAQLTHELGACCFSTAILDMIYHVQPQQDAGAGAGAAPGAPCTVQGGGGGGGSGKARQPASTSSKHAPASARDSSGGKTVVTAPQPDTGMTRDSTAVNLESSLAGAGLSASAATLQHSGSSGLGAAAAAADADALVAGEDGAVMPSGSNSKGRCGCCCWRCQSCTEYPTVLAVYVYCCLGCIMVYLLLVCSDVTYPWLLSAYKHMESNCSSEGPSGRLVCRPYWNHTLPPFSQQFNLLMMITSVPGLSNGSNTTADCVLPSLTCEL